MRWVISAVPDWVIVGDQVANAVDTCLNSLGRKFMGAIVPADTNPLTTDGLEMDSLGPNLKTKDEIDTRKKHTFGDNSVPHISIKKGCSDHGKRCYLGRGKQICSG